MEEIQLEQYFPYKNMTIEERNFIINFLYYSKDFNESIISVNNFNKQEIVTCKTERQNNKFYKINGFSCIPYCENRCFNGTTKILKNGDIVIQNDITRLCINENNNRFPKNYQVVDTFKKTTNSKYIRTTKYSFLNNEFIQEIIVDNYNISDFNKKTK